MHNLLTDDEFKKDNPLAKKSLFDIAQDSDEDGWNFSFYFLIIKKLSYKLLEIKLN